MRTRDQLKQMMLDRNLGEAQEPHASHRAIAEAHLLSDVTDEIHN